MKRCFVIGAFILGLLAVSLLLFIRFFDINAHRDFISKQIQQLSGYQVDFEAIDSHLFSDSTLSLSGLSVTKANRKVLYVDQVKVSLTRLNLWDRALELGPVQLTGMRIRGSLADFTTDEEVKGKDVKTDVVKTTDADTADVQTAEKSKNVQQTTQEKPTEQKLAWQRFTIGRLSVNDLTLDITHGGQRLLADGVDFSTDNLLIIADRQLVKTPLSGNLKLLVREFTALQAANETLKAKNLQLNGSFNLKGLQASLMLQADSLNLALAGQKEFELQNTELVAELNNHKARITQLSSKMFSGELQLKAEALFSINPLSAPLLSVQQLTVQHLEIKDMDLIIPAMLKDSGEVSNNKPLFSINSLVLKEFIVKNVNIRSINSKIPLVVKNLNSSILDFDLLQNNQLGGLAPEDKEAGSFTVQFDYLQWMESHIEQFEISGKLSKSDRSILLIKQLLAG